MEWTALNGRVNSIVTQGVPATGSSTGLYSVALGASNAKAGYSPIAPGVDYDARGIILQFIGDMDRDILLDVSTTSGSSGRIIEDLYLSISTNIASWMYLPIFIPANTPLFASGQQTQISAQTVEMGVMFIRNSWNDSDTFSRMVQYGAIPSSTSAQAIDPGASANTWGSWTTIVSGTAYPMDTFATIVGDGNNTNLTAANYFFEIGVGSVGQEVPIFRGAFMANANDDVFYPFFFGPLPMMIPSGSRVSARGMCSITDATDRVFCVQILGFD